MTTIGPPLRPSEDAPAWTKSYPANVDWRESFEAAPLYRLIDDAARKSPNLPCTTFLGRTTSYAEIGRMVDAAAAGLHQLGVRKGTKVGLFLPNSPTFIIYYFAILKAGGVVVNYNPLYTTEELSFQVKDSDTELMVTLDLKILFDKVERLLEDGVLKGAVVCSFTALLPPTKAVLFRLLKSRELGRVASSPQRSRIRLRVGTCRGWNLRARGRRSPQRYRRASVHRWHHRHPQGGHAHARQRLHQRCPGDVLGTELVYGEEKVLGVLPFLPRVRHDRGDELRHRQGCRDRHHAALRARRCAEPHQSHQAVDHARRADPLQRHHEPPEDQILRSIELALLPVGRAALPIEVRQKFEAVTGCALIEGYGLSETSPVATANSIDGLIKAGSIGLPRRRRTCRSETFPIRASKFQGRAR